MSRSSLDEAPVPPFAAPRSAVQGVGAGVEGDDVAYLEGAARGLELEPKRGVRVRESHVESANQAAGIFSLYGDLRTSWASSTATGKGIEIENGNGYDTANGNGNRNGNGNGFGNGNTIDLGAENEIEHAPVHIGATFMQGPVEELDEEEELRGCHDGEDERDVRASRDTWTSKGPSSIVSGTASRASGWSDAPPITVTPDHKAIRTPDKRYATEPGSGTGLSGGSGRMVGGATGNGGWDGRPNGNRASVLTTSTMDSPSHPAMTRLSPRQPSTATSATASANTSQVSIAGSSQYPGEENDAFHVRSTYARLESSGVHGDGWDPGVERTRGGPQAGKRVTMQPAFKRGDVGQKEREFLVSLDRYGFVDEPLRNRSETRLALIPAAPLTRIPKLPARSPIPKSEKVPPPSAFLPGTSEAGPLPRVPSSPSIAGEDDRHRRKETERVGKWMKMMKVKDRDVGGNIASWAWRTDGQGTKLPKRVYKGIPDRWRMAAWWTMAEDRKAEYKGKGKATRAAEDLIFDYRHQIDLPSTHDVQIDLDVPRTISGHTMFVTRYGAGQRSLFHVLHSFSLLCDDCGYCQGMGPIAATLLCYFDPERAYALLVRLHDVYGMHSIFAPGFPGLLEAFYVQERLMEWLMPDVYRAFQRNMISSSAWGTKWYITLFVNTVPFSQQLRLWDAMWLDGRDVMVLTAVAIVWSFKDLLAAPTATFESILSLLSSFFVAEDEDALMRWIRRTINSPGMREKMAAWRREWQALVADGKSEQALL